MKTKLLHLMILLVGSTTASFAQPIITSQPQSVTNLAGTTATFSVTASGAPPLAYQWLLNSAIPLTSATNADFILTNVQSFNAGSYSVIVTNVEGAVTGVVATLTVRTPPRITKQPTNQTASLFADATFRVTASGDALLSYQWRFNDADLIGKTSTVLTVTNVQRTNAGNYTVVVTNFSGWVTSQVATLTITPFNSMYEFGFSWTQTQDALCSGPTACPSCYWQSHYCNGPMWPEFLSADLGLVYVAANNYAFCGATSADILNQVIDFPAPPKPKLSLYCLWANGPDTPSTNELTWTDRLLQTAILNNSNSVNRLYAKGARSIVIQLNFDEVKLPGNASDFGINSALASRYSAYLSRFNAGLRDVMNTYAQTRLDLRIMFVDVFSKLGDVIANPAQYGFTRTDIGALDDPTLTDKSFTGPGADLSLIHI